MKKILTVFFTLMVTWAYGQTQAQMSNKAYASYQKADLELNKVYKSILVKYKADVEFLKNLKASQRIWVSFRDAELKMKYPNREPGYYGSIHPVCRASYLENLTLERTRKLREWLKEVNEGDACTGSVQAK
ncbi:lysozyme inhibitor LprI family protein [Adhaeribacter pallidiroseus]|uniref:Lysozyme inhibitor LprI-like N-terminal domain-containing protein n=1 Tax=Adhaeribacter pallidiroseus TaxID=2072847 RepID=A0A369QG56_9BACT|nr:lysozyme inhibitor LprI family protein [Adhaeribacter pallidiroseus]RDC63911.1 hypothetical protein AHMF7616_02520 [Adhaeribacter pallidiroseus]